MANDLITPNGFLEANDSENVRLVSLISNVWEKAKGKAAIAVNTEFPKDRGTVLASFQ